MALKTFILAAGLGTRLRPYTNHLPKPAVPFLGVPMLGYAMYLSHKAQVYDLVMNTHPMPEKIKHCFSQLSQNRFQAQFSLEEGEPQGSGGALYYARDHLNNCEHFFAINGDTVFVPFRENLLQELLTEHKKHNAICTLVVSEDPKLIAQFNPLWIDSDNSLVGIGTKPEHTESRPAHYMGVKVFSNNVFKYIPAGNTNIFKDVLFPAMARGEKVQTFTESCTWWETGNFDSFLAATVDAMKMIETREDYLFFERVYQYFNKSFDFVISHKGDATQFIHRQSTISLKSVSGNAFIDSLSKSKNDVALKDVIVNSGASVTESSTNAMFFEEDKW